MSKTPGYLRRLWYNWKMKPFPWRQNILKGYDLQGNTFWEFKDALNAGRQRRIVKYNSWTHHGDVKVPPQWMQWLRHTRPDAPTLAEQQADIFRQQQMKQLAAQADARWAAKPSFLDAPDKQQPTQMLQSRDPTSGIRQTAVDHESQPSRTPKEVEDVKDEPEQSNDAPALKTRKLRSEPKARDSPWEQATKRNSGDEWTPAAWSPAPARKRA